MPGLPPSRRPIQCFSTGRQRQHQPMAPVAPFRSNLKTVAGTRAISSLTSRISVFRSHSTSASNSRHWLHRRNRTWRGHRKKPLSCRCLARASPNLRVWRSSITTSEVTYTPTYSQAASARAAAININIRTPNWLQNNKLQGVNVFFFAGETSQLDSRTKADVTANHPTGSSRSISEVSLASKQTSVRK